MIDFSVFEYVYDENRKMSIYKCVTVYINMCIYVSNVRKNKQKKNTVNIRKK